MMNTKQLLKEINESDYVDLSQFNQGTELKLSWLPQGLQIKVREMLKSGYSIKGFFLCKNGVTPPQIQAQPADWLDKRQELYVEISNLKNELKQATEVKSEVITTTVVPKGTKMIRDEEDEAFLLMPKYCIQGFAEASKEWVKVIATMQQTLRATPAAAKLREEYDASLVADGFAANPSEDQKEDIPFNALTRFDKFIRLIEATATPESVKAQEIVRFKIELREILELFNEIISTGKTDKSIQ